MDQIHKNTQICSGNKPVIKNHKNSPLGLSIGWVLFYERSQLCFCMKWYSHLPAVWFLLLIFKELCILLDRSFQLDDRIVELRLCVCWDGLKMGVLTNGFALWRHCNPFSDTRMKAWFLLQWKSFSGTFCSKSHETGEDTLHQNQQAHNVQLHHIAPPTFSQQSANICSISQWRGLLIFYS